MRDGELSKSVNPYLTRDFSKASSNLNELNELKAQDK